MTLVRHRLLTPDGEPVEHRQVVARLIAPASWLADHSGEVIHYATASSGPDGWVDLELTPQSKIASAGTHYEVRVTQHATHHCVVPDAGPVQLSAILVDPTTLNPVPLPPPSLLVLTGDPRLSDPRTPTLHAASHGSGGSDPITPADIGADSLLGSYRHSARALRDRLASNQRCVWVHLGDSTANAPDEWLQLALHQFGGDYPNQRFEHRLWSDANQNFDAASMVQPGISSGVEPPPIVRDTFTRTAAALSGTAADTGQVWGGGNGTLDGAVYTIGNVAASVVHGIDPKGPDGMIVRGRFTIPSGTTSGTVRLFALAYNGTDELFAEIGPSGTGLGLNLYQRVGGTATNIGSGVSIALANSADRIADLSLSFKAGQATATLTANGTTVTRSAAVTVPGGWVGYAASARNLVITAPAGYKVDDVSAGLNAPDPAPLVVYNGSMPGASLAYHQARVAAMLPEAPDLVTIASSHNHGTQSTAAFLAQIDALVSAVLALYPDAGIALVSQNPQFPPANNAAVRAAHNIRIIAVGPHARARGFGYIPGAEPFLGRDDRGQGVVVTDGIHPSATGSVLWRDAGLSYLRGQVSHAASHATDGSDPITPASIGALDQAAVDARYDALDAASRGTRSVMQQGRKIPLGDAATWSAGLSGTGTTTTGTDPVVGDYLRIATTAQTAYRIGRDLPVRLDGGKVISFLMRRNDANLSVLDLWLGLGAFGTNPGVQWNKSVGTIDVGVWRRVVVHPQEREQVTGTPDYADLRALWIRPTPTAATDTSIDIADIRVHDGAKPGWISFVFDDGRADTYTTAFPRLAAKGYPAGIAVEHTAVGNPDRCTLAQLQEMYAAGWDMYGHHVVQMTTLDEAAQVVVHRASKSFLSANGLRRGERIWVWPGGARSPATEAIARRYWQTMRRVAAFNVLGSPHIYEPVDPAVFYVTSTATLATLKDRIDRVAASGGHLVFVLHSLVTTPVAAEDWRITDFQALLDYIDTADVLVKPVSEAWTL